ncbi:hypothetical protein RM545_08995 [Zunongwangia sp. F260]|uniref:Uncharacterized protein n=1 Tax=Autumnicola lenta TaxID=3075593 RepID=A0ABU3CKI5_9FLAO|nr:hypothetical protein [Zunongwangia sp. F260]MDT0646826.1 hypothetical protein [Zunongwangia sp. F260]
MLDFDQETWLYLAIIAAIFIYFRTNSRRAKIDRKNRKNRNFRRRYLERRKQEKSEETFQEKNKP